MFLSAPHAPPYLVTTYRNFSCASGCTVPGASCFPGKRWGRSPSLFLTPLRPPVFLQDSHYCLLVSSLCLKTGKDFVMKGSISKSSALNNPRWPFRALLSSGEVHGAVK